MRPLCFQKIEPFKDPVHLFPKELLFVADGIAHSAIAVKSIEGWHLTYFTKRAISLSIYSQQCSCMFLQTILRGVPQLHKQW
jgi:hypothetical protein